MKAVFRNHTARARQLRSERQDTPQQSPEHSDSAGSGTYFRAVRPTDVEAAALAQGQPIIDVAKLNRLRFALEAALWRADVELIARRMLEDADLNS
jgi:hypothetical protein